MEVMDAALEKGWDAHWERRLIEEGAEAWVLGCTDISELERKDKERDSEEIIREEKGCV